MFVVAGFTILVLSILGTGLLQVGDWFQHRRHLQTRADAAVLAAAQQFNDCFDTATYPNPNNAATNIEAWATAYAGFSTAATTAAGAPTKNLQFGGGTDPLPAFNSNSYPDGVNTGDTTGTAPNGVCGDLKLDVKLADTSIPRLFGLFNLPSVHAHARVQLQQVVAARPSLPIAIPSFDTSDVGVTFVDEATGTELSGCPGALQGTGCTFVAPGPATTFLGTNGQGYKQWTLGGLQVKFPALPTGTNFKDIGVRVSVGAAPGSCDQSFGDGTNNYACIMLGSTDGASMILESRGTQTAPSLTSITPASTCATGAAPFFSDSSPGTTCSVSLTATVAFPANATNKKVTATIINNGGTFGTCTLNNTSGTTWSGTCPPIPIDTAQADSEYQVQLNYSYGPGNNKGCFNGCSPVARFTSATDSDDGPLKDLLVSTYSVNGGSSATTQSVGVTITVASAGISKNEQLLRAGHKGSSTSYILCYQPNPPNGPVEGGTPGIQDGIVHGCTVTYQINQNGTCPDNSSPYPDCAQNKPSNDSGNPIGKAFNQRFNCGSPGEADNHWPDITRVGDPRAVTLVITSYNAYVNGGKSNGNQQYPVTGFGDFYVTGFDGSKCTGDQAPPGSTSGKGDVWGYFIKYSRQGDIPSGSKCVANDFGECVAVLTR